MTITPLEGNETHSFVSSILSHTKTYKKTIRGLTFREADEKAWQWLMGGFSEPVGNKIVHIKPDDILTIEIRKAV